MRVIWEPSAERDMRRLDPPLARQVRDQVERFAFAGAGNVKRLRGEGGYAGCAPGTGASVTFAAATICTSSPSNTAPKPTGEPLPLLPLHRRRRRPAGAPPGRALGTAFHAA
jgi:hypothetical protein